MEDQKIFKLALFTTIFGLLGVMFSANYINPQEVKIKDMNRGMLDKEVSVEGLVTDVSQSRSGGTYFLELMDGTGKIKLIIFESAASEIQKTGITIKNFNKRRLRVVGRVTEYHGSLEVILKDSNSLKIIA
ncbi:MAG: exodeoxyribonuclease VII large subunit [Methanobacterium sp.]|jgi:DNA/RNA endonuclease YhcR with UshA esterase domain|nr:exodeoxyribonuclease VII large subunit [Methanobacterium sp.]HHY00194.1 exodeoxyribonuclease VII large subunit [Methanothermobacter sp.]